MLVAWTVYAVLLHVALLALSLSWLGRARRGWRTTPRSLLAGEPEPDQEPDATTAGSSAHDASSTAQGDEWEARPERSTAGSSAQDDAGSPARAVGRPARAAAGDAATEGGAGSSATAAAAGSTATAAGGLAQGDKRWHQELGELLTDWARTIADPGAPGAHENRRRPRLRARDLLMASSEGSASSGPDDEATNRSVTPSTTHRRRVRPGRSAGRPAAAGTSTVLSRLLLKCNASEIYGEMSKRQLRAAGVRLHEAVDAFAASQPMATER